MPAKAKDEISVGNRRQLLFDDFFLALRPGQYPAHPERVARGVRWALARVEKHPQRIFFGQQPWEDDKQWLCILREGGTYRLWYNSIRQPHPGLRVSYAESQDGLNWRRPDLNLVEWQGVMEKNVVYTGTYGVSFELGSVFVDPTAGPEKRYRMVGSEWIDARIFQPGFVGNAGGVTSAVSADGIHWQPESPALRGWYSDSQNVCAYDPTAREYICFVRGFSWYGGCPVGEHPVKAITRGRAVARIASDDFVIWSDAETVLQGDLHDGLNVDFYNSGYSRYPGADNAHFMFASALHRFEGTLDVQVAVSRDNHHWIRPTRDVLIPHGEPGGFDCFMVFAAPGFVPIDDDHYAIYYRAVDSPHHGGSAVQMPAGFKRVDAMGRAVLTRDRIVGIEAGEQEGTFCTRPLVFEGRRLLLNLEPTGPDPWLTVQVVSADDEEPFPGYTSEESIPLMKDELDAVATWKKGADLGQFAGRPVRLHFRLKSMRIYAFQFVG